MKIRSHKTKSGISRLFVGFRSGSRVEFGTRFPYGTAHMLEHMMFKGTSKRTSKQIMEDFSIIGASVNAFTSFNSVVFTLDVLNKNLEKGIEIFSDMILNARFPEEEFKKEKLVVLQEESSVNDEIGSFANSFEFEHVFDGSLSIPIIGTEDSIKSITLKHIKDFNKRFIDSSQAGIFISSSLSKKDSKSLIESYFGKSNGRLKKPMKIKPSSFLERRTVFEERSDIGHNYVDIMYEGPEPKTEDFTYMSIISYLIGGSMDSKLFISVREDKGLVYGIHSSNANIEEFCIFNISFSCIKDNVKEVITTIDEVIQKILKEGFSEKDLKKAKVMSEVALASSMDSESYNVFAEFRNFMYGDILIEERVRRIEQASLERLNKVFRDYFSKERFVFIFGEECDY